MFKVNGVSPPVGADQVTLADGDEVLWYYATFSDTGGPRTLSLKATAANCYAVSSFDDAGKAVSRRRRAGPRRRPSIQDRRQRSRAVSGGTSDGSSVRRRRRAVERREVTPRRCTLLLLAALALAGCGGEGPTAADGTAHLWVTRDRGSELLVDTTVPAGQTLLRALRSEAKVTTRYGGGFVQSIDGVEGSARRHEDWFWFVNGLAGDRSAASYRLRDGDVAWWDYRDWSGDADTLEVVTGAFPEPFLHGYDGKSRPAAVRYGPGLRAGRGAHGPVARDRRRRARGHDCRARTRTCSSSRWEHRT